MEALTRQEYPSMLERLQPSVAVAKLNDRVKKINKINSEIADWLQERRKIERVYAASLRKLALRSVQGIKDQMGVFDHPWAQIMTAAEDIAKSHIHLSQCIERDLERPLREFSLKNDEMSSITTMQGNISTLARELEDAQVKSKRLAKKGGNTHAARIDAAKMRVQAAGQQWDVQAAFIFESLQALDERRINHLRNILTQYQTHEADHIERNRKITERTLQHVIEVNTDEEIRNWSQTVAENFPVRQTPATGISSVVPPPNAPSIHDDDNSEHSLPSKSEHGEKNKLQRIGTMFIRRRQTVHHSTHPGTDTLKNGHKFHGRGLSSRSDKSNSSPKASSIVIKEPENHLASLPESPKTLHPSNAEDEGKDLDLNVDLPIRNSSLHSAPNTTIAGSINVAEGDSFSESQSPLQHPDTKENQEEKKKSIPPATNDPISQVQQEFAQADQPHFKLNIQKEPIPEQDSDAEAAVSNLANTLRSSQVRKTGVFRGRRETRYMMQNTSADTTGTTQEKNLKTSLKPSSPTSLFHNAVASSSYASNEHSSTFGSDQTSIKSEQSWSLHSSRHVDSNLPGLICSIVETMSASFERETFLSMKITGEVALIYNPDTSNDLSNIQSCEIVKIDDVSNLQISLPNKSLIQPVSADSTNLFTVNLTPISSKYAVAFTYHISNLEILQTQAPLLMKPVWKNQGDKIGLVLEYSLNPSYSLTPVTFNNLILVAHYCGTGATSCQTKPSGIHIKDKLLVYWRLGTVTLDKTWIKVIARFAGTENSVPEPGHIEAKWELGSTNNTSPINMSRIKLFSKVLKSDCCKEVQEKIESKEKTSKEVDEGNNPFSDERASVSPTVESAEDEGWKEVITFKKLVSGNYISKV